MELRRLGPSLSCRVQYLHIALNIRFASWAVLLRVECLRGAFEVRHRQDINNTYHMKIILCRIKFLNVYGAVQQHTILLLVHEREIKLPIFKEVSVGLVMLFAHQYQNATILNNKHSNKVVIGNIMNVQEMPQVMLILILP